MDQPLLSIVVGTVDRHQGIQKLIDSIEAHTRIPWELVITDASQTPIRPRAKHPIRIIREWPRAGHARGYNRAFRRCQGQYVVWLNDDCEVMPNWAESAVAFMEANSWCGLGALYYSERGGPWHISEYQEMIYANFGIISRELGDIIGWFDDDCLVMYGADNSIAFKTLMAGRGVAGIPGSRVRHYPVMDAFRRDNVSRQLDDAKGLMHRYRLHLPAIKALYDRFPKSPMQVQ